MRFLPITKVRGIRAQLFDENDVTKIDQKEVVVSQTGVGSLIRKVRIVSGHVYIISPLNPRNMKNRDRHVIALKAVQYTPGQNNGDVVCCIRFKDNNRIGRTDFCNLEPVDPADRMPVD